MDFLNPAFWTFVAVIAGIYAILSLGLYVQFSLAGLPNFGHVAFMAVAAYTMAILVVRYAVPMPLAAGAGLLGAILLALILGIPTLRLRADYLAIATVAGGEIIRYLAMNLPDLTGGPIGSIGLLGPGQIALYNGGWLAFLDRIAANLSGVVGARVSRDGAAAILVWALAGFLVLVLWRSERSPWGRVLKAIREDEAVAASVGKDVFRFKMQALVLGAMLMGLGGSFYAHYVKFISPDTFNPLMGTFLIWVMLMAGGSGNNRGAIVGAAVIWGLWSFSDVLTDKLPAPLDTRGSYLRVMLIGLVLQGILLKRPQGIIPEH